MSFRVNINLEQYSSGSRRVFQRVRKVEGAVESAITPVSIAMADRVKDRILEVLRAPKSGITWSKDNPLSGGWWENYYSNPSGAAGQAPANQTGSLASSVQVKTTSKGRANLDVGGSGGRPGIARLLEFGGWRTVFGNVAAPHPFVRPSLEAEKGNLRQVAIDEYRKHVKI